MPANVLTNFKNQLPTLLIMTLWGVEMVGQYSITVRVLQIPSTFLAKAIGRVFFSTVSNLKRDGKDIGKYVANNMTRGMRLAIIPMTALIAFGDLVVIITLGKEWSVAGDFLKILTLQYFFMFITQSVQGLPAILEKQNYAMLSGVLQIIGYIFGAIIGRYIFNDIYIGLVSMSILFIIINIVYYCFLFYVMNVPIKKYLINITVSLSIIIITSFTARKIFDVIGITDLILRLL